MDYYSSLPRDDEVRLLASQYPSLLHKPNLKMVVRSRGRDPD